MAVTLTPEEYGATLGPQPNDTGPLRRQFAALTALVETRAPDAPDAIQNQALVMLGGFIQFPLGSDAGWGEGYNPRFIGSAWYASGAALFTKEWAARRAAQVPDA